MIDGGQLKQTGRPEDLMKAAGNFVVEYFENGKTVQRFFDTEEAAIASINREPAAQSPRHEIKVRPANLEDAFILLTNKRLDSETSPQIQD